MTDHSHSFEFQVIGYIESCFKQKFGIPRQPGLVKQATATLTLLPEYSHPDIVRGLEQFSHIWLVFVFHQSIREQWKNTVRPPRLGGNERMGVFATRSNFRPNPIGQSAVKLESINHHADQIQLSLSGVDLLDATPVLDIKPYLPYADIISNAQAGMANKAPEKQFIIEYSSAATSQLKTLQKIHGDGIAELIIEILSYDVRPSYLSNENPNREFNLQLFDFDLKWTLSGNQITILEINR